MKPDLRHVTLVCYENRDHTAALSLMAAMTRAMDFGGARLLNHFHGWAQFNYWENYETWKYVTTSHALIVHLDGYILRPRLWNKDWLDLDYIGAPWPEALNSNRVGNGGFCLKSRRFMNAVAALPYPRGREGDTPLPGDVLACSFYRPTLIDAGMTYATVAEAAKFSVEVPIKETPTETFGFHGQIDNPLHGYPLWNPLWKELPGFSPRTRPSTQQLLKEAGLE